MSFDLPNDEELDEIGKSSYQPTVIPDGHYAVVVTGLRTTTSKASQHMVFIGANPCTRFGDVTTAVQGIELSCMLMLPTWDDDEVFAADVVAKWAKKNNGKAPSDEELKAEIETRKSRAWRQLASAGRALKGDTQLPEVPIKRGDQIKDRAGNVYTREQQQARIAERNKAALEFMREVVDGKIKIGGYYAYALTETSEYNNKKESRIRYLSGELAADKALVPASEWTE